MPYKPAPQEYQSYLIRFRRMQAQPPAWHVSVQDVRTGEWRHFTDLALLFEFVSQELTLDVPNLPEE
ncbi:MAG: hypothetical protein IPM39_22985 [Chloroflexi bacterium]|nr:hypothetical protein [Chloroflexota bacterium]